MTGTRTLASGALLACLLASLTSCANDPIVQTRTVEKPVPVVVDVPEQLTAQEKEPRLPPEPVNDDLLELIDRLQAWGRLGWCRIEDIANLGPSKDQHAACGKVREEVR